MPYTKRSQNTEMVANVYNSDSDRFDQVWLNDLTDLDLFDDALDKALDLEAVSPLLCCVEFVCRIA